MLTAAGSIRTTGTVTGVIVPHRPLILGHRGASHHEAENTLPAFRRAVDDRADGIECDVRLTSDGVMVMHHDPVVEGLGALSGTNFATLRQVHPSVPTLDETLALLPNPSFLLNLELKNDPDEPGFDPAHGVATAVARWIGEHSLHDRVLVSSFNRDAVDQVRVADDRIPTGLLLGHWAGVRSHARGVAADGHSWILPHHLRLAVLAAQTVAAAHDAGLKIGTWTVDAPWRVAALSRAWIDAIITNDPASANKVLR